MKQIIITEEDVAYARQFLPFSNMSKEATREKLQAKVDEILRKEDDTNGTRIQP